MNLQQRDNGSKDLTIGVRYNKQRHRTEFTIRNEGKIVDEHNVTGELTDPEIQKKISEIKRSFQ